MSEENVENTQSAEELFESLNGFDEITINNAFGSDVAVLAENQPTTFLRALIFVAERRAGKPDSAAYKASMEMTTKDVAGRFTDDSDEIFEEDTESGKDESQPGPEPVTSLPSAS